MFDIKQFLNILGTFSKIDFSGKKSDIELLAKKYDINNNSVFEKDEIQSIKDDLIVHANKDGECDNLNEIEAQEYLESLLDKEHNLSDFIKETEGSSEKFVIELLKRLCDIGKESSRKDYINNKFGDKCNKIVTRMLSELSDEDFQWAEKYLFDKNIPPYYMHELAQFHNKDLEELLEQRTDFRVDTDSYGGVDYLTLIIDGKSYLYDKDGLVEIIEFQDVNDEKYGECELKNITNQRLNVKQDILTKTIPTEIIAIEEKLNYYDENKNIVKSVEAKRNPQDWSLNIAETYADGRIIPIQWESNDPETGEEITERNLISPDGVKTEFYSEKSDDFKITEYKIVDKNNDELINICQTFQKISDNKFVSSISTNGTNEQVYEIVYNDNGGVSVRDVKNDKIAEFNISEYFEDEIAKEKLMPIIKQLPGQVLIKFAENPLRIKYDEETTLNASWDKKDLLTMGDYSEIVSENESMFAVLTHELGHYLDFYNTDVGKISTNQEMLEIFSEELESFNNFTTTEQKKYLEYYIEDSWYNDEPLGDMEKVAETHSIMYSTNAPKDNLTRFYLAQYFPRTIAAIMKLLLSEEGIAAE